MTPSTDDFALSRPDVLVGFFDLPVDAKYSSIDARSPGLILGLELEKRLEIASHLNVCGGKTVSIWYAAGRSNSTSLPFSRLYGLCWVEIVYERTFYFLGRHLYWQSPTR